MGCFRFYTVCTHQIHCVNENSPAKQKKSLDVFWQTTSVQIWGLVGLEEALMDEGTFSVLLLFIKKPFKSLRECDLD